MHEEVDEYDPPSWQKCAGRHVRLEQKFVIFFFVGVWRRTERSAGSPSRSSLVADIYSSLVVLLRVAGTLCDFGDRKKVYEWSEIELSTQLCCWIADRQHL